MEDCPVNPFKPRATICTICVNIRKLCIMPAQRIVMILRINSSFVPNDINRLVFVMETLCIFYEVMFNILRLFIRANVRGITTSDLFHVKVLGTNIFGFSTS
jgi:hypothetical protein